MKSRDEILKAQQDRLTHIQDAFSNKDELVKGGKLAQIGEVRTHGGRKVQKTTDGWKPVSEGGDKAAEIKAVEDKIKRIQWNNQHGHSPMSEQRELPQLRKKLAELKGEGGDKKLADKMSKREEGRRELDPFNPKNDFERFLIDPKANKIENLSEADVKRLADLSVRYHSAAQQLKSYIAQQRYGKRVPYQLIDKEKDVMSDILREGSAIVEKKIEKSHEDEITDHIATRKANILKAFDGSET